MAIKVNGTTVIDNSRQLTNIASVDATTVAALGAAGVGGGGKEWTNAGSVSLGSHSARNTWRTGYVTLPSDFQNGVTDGVFMVALTASRWNQGYTHDSQEMELYIGDHDPSSNTNDTWRISFNLRYNWSTGTGIRYLDNFKFWAARPLGGLDPNKGYTEAPSGLWDTTLAPTSVSLFGGTLGTWNQTNDGNNGNSFESLALRDGGQGSNFMPANNSGWNRRMYIGAKGETLFTSATATFYIYSA